MTFNAGTITVIADPETKIVAILWRHADGTLENISNTDTGVIALSDAIRSVCNHRELLCNECCNTQCAFAL